MSRLIESLNEQQALNKCADGYEVYWTENNTYLTASHIREIADELDRRNKTWHEQVMQDVGAPMPKIKPLVWEKAASGWTAETPLGDCWVDPTQGAWEAWVFGFVTFKDTEAEAKAWCQQEYERRVRECLE